MFYKFVKFILHFLEWKAVLLSKFVKSNVSVYKNTEPLMAPAPPMNRDCFQYHFRIFDYFLCQNCRFTQLFYDFRNIAPLIDDEGKEIEQVLKISSWIPFMNHLKSLWPYWSHWWFSIPFEPWMAVSDEGVRRDACRSGNCSVHVQEGKLPWQFGHEELLRKA